jgi:GT2 family glycosyltransferase
VWSRLTIDMFLDQHRAVRLARAVTANLFVRRERFAALNGFDESLPSGGDYDFTARLVEAQGRLIYSPDAVVVHPTMDAADVFLRKVWRTNQWAAARRARSKQRPSLTGLLAFVPFVGVALARRMALRPPFSLERSRLRACGVELRRRDELEALTMLYFVVAYVAGFAQVRGWLGASFGQTPGRPVYTKGLAGSRPEHVGEHV